MPRPAHSCFSPRPAASGQPHCDVRWDEEDITEVPCTNPEEMRHRAYRGDPTLSFVTSLCCRPTLCNVANQAVMGDFDEDSEVILHVYDIVESGLLRRANQVLQGLGTGAFHVGVEVYGWEWSFGDSSSGTGVFYCKPKVCGSKQYRESVSIGTTAFSGKEVDIIIRRMEQEWPGESYDLFRRNCCHFCEQLCRLLVRNGAVPPWISTLSGVGAAIQDRITAFRRTFATGGLPNCEVSQPPRDHPKVLQKTSGWRVQGAYGIIAL